MLGRSCAECEFRHVVRIGERVYSECRRFPPAADCSQIYCSSFPEVLPEEWCGEFKSRRDDVSQ